MNPQTRSPAMDILTKLNEINNNVVQSHHILLNLIQQSQSQNLSLIDYVKQNAKIESAAYVDSHMSDAVLFTDYKDFWTHALTKAKPGGIFAEFGVWSGTSINFIADAFKGEQIYGFDSFEGLKEDWRGCVDHPAGKFNKEGKLPDVRPNVRLIKGWFDQSIPGWIANLKNQNCGKVCNFPTCILIAIPTNRRWSSSLCLET